MKNETPDQRAQRLIGELREATREAAGVVKDLNAAARAAREQVDGYLSHSVQATLDRCTEQWQAGVDKFARDAMAEIQRVIDNAVAKADAAVEAASTLEVLTTAVVDAVMRHTQYVDGEPVIVYDPPGGTPDRKRIK